MITHNPARVQAQVQKLAQEAIGESSSTSHINPSWQRQLADIVTCPKILLELLGLNHTYLDDATSSAKSFSLRVPMAFISRMEKGNINDPLLRQVLPTKEELAAVPNGYVFDPLDESNTNKVPGIIHKYSGRALLIINGSCAVHCRYCFRRHFPYDDNQLSLTQWSDSLEYIRNDTSITEIILSGGDPLSSSDKRLFHLIEEIESIAHIKRLRIHTRLPIVIPDRVTQSLVKRLKDSRLQQVMVVHANHAQEINSTVASALTYLADHGIQMLNQTVLLKGVNDQPGALINLSEALMAARTLPYYLHLLDPVIGAHHFEVNEALAKSLLLDIQRELPGYLVPKLVREIPNMPSKTLIPY